MTTHGVKQDVREMTKKAFDDTELQVFSTELEVRWSDFDQFGHVNHAQYIEYAQDARMKFAFENFISRGKPFPTAVVRHLEVDYLRPVLSDSRHVIVDIEVIQIGRTSFTMRHTIRDCHGDVACVVDAAQVLFDVKTSQSVPIAADDRKLLARYAVPELASGGTEPSAESAQ